MKQIFKKGDKVFCVLGGWGTVISINKGDYPIAVEFDRSHYTYSEDGRVNDHTPPTLSFTEYTLEGFSQERPEKLPSKGDVVWVRDEDGEHWRVTHFIEKSQDSYWTSIDMQLRTLMPWKQLTTINPNNQ
jgi:hypothetical protein